MGSAQTWSPSVRPRHCPEASAPSAQPQVRTPAGALHETQGYKCTVLPQDSAARAVCVSAEILEENYCKILHDTSHPLAQHPACALSDAIHSLAVTYLTALWQQSQPLRLEKGLRLNSCEVET